MIEQKTKDDIKNHLEVLVGVFNKAFLDWQEVTGCRANFAWDYADKSLPKKLVIKDIDAMIYAPGIPEWVKKQNELLSPKGE